LEGEHYSRARRKRITTESPAKPALKCCKGWGHQQRIKCQLIINETIATGNRKYPAKQLCYLGSKKLSYSANTKGSWAGKNYRALLEKESKPNRTQYNFSKLGKYKAFNAKGY
jgi:hypothetical protein